MTYWSGPGSLNRNRPTARVTTLRLPPRLLYLLAALAVTSGMDDSLGRVQAQGPSLRFGEKVPADVQVIYERGLRYLVKSQSDNGSWAGRGRSNYGSGEHGISGLCVMAFLASGEDPNFGPYSSNVRRALRNMILGQNSSTGYLGSSMYHHGFATLGLAEAYGAVDDSLIWKGDEPAARRRSIGEALDLAVRCATTSQKNNQWGGWRYSPESRDADSSVSGAVLVGLLAARNAGIAIPDSNIDKALTYFKSHTAKGGTVAYSGGVGGGSQNMTAIAALVYAVGRKKDWTQFRATAGYLQRGMQQRSNSYPFYNRYYMAQAMFQSDFDAWQKWNRETIRILKKEQAEDGSFQSGHGNAYGTAMSLLALALNYRFLPIYER